MTWGTVPSFLSEDKAQALRDQALRATWRDHVSEQDGETYRRVAPAYAPEVADALAVAMGRPVSIVAMGFRLNFAGELPNAAIHSDGDGWGTHALVLPLDLHPPAGNGTAFWEHIATGKQYLASTDVEGVLAMAHQWNAPDEFDQVGFVQARWNQALIYRSDLLHSRWPFEAYGSTPEDGRLTLVVFFT